MTDQRERGDSIQPRDDPSGDSSAFLGQLAEHSPGKSRYTLMGELARGGMGAILKVWDADLRRHLAMKVVLGSESQDGSDGATPVEPTLLNRFLEEAQVTGQLDHPGIVPVHELGVDEQGRAYFTMRLVKGRDLKAIFEQVRTGAEGWNRERAVGVLLKACEALAYAHSHGVIHRDLKPANIMVGRFGEVYVMDWGLARVKGRQDTRDLRLRPEGTSLHSVQTLRRDEAENTPDSPLITMDGDVMGTPAYMSPEQARGELDRLGPRSDVYAMGAILYELLTGCQPYMPPGVKRSPRVVLAAAQEEPPKPVHSLAPDVPMELEAICDRAMAREPADRYADVSELSDDLRAYVEGRVVQAHATGAIVELKKWARRNKGLAATLGLLFIVGAGLLVMGQGMFDALDARDRALVAESLANEARVELEQALDREAAARQLAEERRLEIQRQSYVANIVAAQASLNDDDLETTRLQLDLAPPEERDNWEWRHLANRLDESIERLPGPEGGVRIAAFTPDGAHAVLGGGDGRLWSWSHEGGSVSLGESRASVAAISPDGGLVATGEVDGSVRLWSTSGGDVRRLGEHSGLVTALAFDPDGGQLASGSIDGTAFVWSTARAVLVETREMPGQAIGSLALGPSGGMLAAGLGDGRIVVWNRDKGPDPLVVGPEEHAVVSLAFSPSGRLLAAGSLGGQVSLRTTRDWALSQEWETGDGPVRALAFSADSRVLATGSDNGVIRLLSGPGPNDWGEWEVDRRGHSDTVLALGFDDRSGTVVSTSRDGVLRMWEGFRLQVPDLWSATHAWHPDVWWGPNSVSAIAVHPDGHLAAASIDGEGMRLWDPVSGLDLAVLREDDWVESIAFQPGGDLLASVHRENVVDLWDTSTGDAHKQLAVPGLAQLVAFDPTGSRIAVGLEDGRAVLVDVSSGAIVETYAGDDEEVVGLSMSADGTRLVVGSWSGWVRLFDVDSGELVDSWKEQDELETVAIHPSGTRVASGASNHMIYLRDLEAGTERWLRGHREAVTALAFSPDGLRLASGSDDGTIRVWHGESGDYLVTLRGHVWTIHDVVFHADGSAILSGGDDESIRTWSAVPRAERRRRRIEARDALEEMGPVVDALFESRRSASAVVEALEEDAEIAADQRRAGRQLVLRRPYAVFLAQREQERLEEARRAEESIALRVSLDVAYSAWVARQEGWVPPAGYAPAQAVGPPNTLPGWDVGSAWAPLEESAGLEWLEVVFERPMVATSVRIHETLNPGSVSAVVLEGERGEEVARISVPMVHGGEPGWREISFDPTDSPILTVRIELDTSRNETWSEIDAVELVGPEDRAWAIFAQASTYYDLPY